jgi:hypothetical protein
MLKKKEIWIVGGLLLVLLLGACGSVATPTAAPQTGTSLGYDDLVQRLREDGAKVEPAGEVDQPFFSVTGQQIMVDGQEVQVFEYTDEMARRAEAAKIAPDGYTVGDTKANWISRPNFWATGRVIVLYVGVDKALVSRLTDLLGDPITPLPDPPAAASAAETFLAQDLNLTVEEIQLVSYEHSEWPDGCLGLGKKGESCTEVITPGWRIVLEAQGQEYALCLAHRRDRQSRSDGVVKSGENILNLL